MHFHVPENIYRFPKVAKYLLFQIHLIQKKREIPELNFSRLNIDNIDGFQLPYLRAWFSTKMHSLLL